MIIWVDAQLSPALAVWIESHFPSIEVSAVRDLGLRHADDIEIFEKARQANAIVMSKDKDFVDLLIRFGAPPKLIWVTCGNTSNAQMQGILQNGLGKALELLAKGESVVEISDK